MAWRKAGRARRGKSNSDQRGSARDRRRRRAWLVETFGIPRKRDGEKTMVKCHHCPRVMRAAYGAWEIDRYPICGHDGGRYVQGNIVVACPDCNRDRCARVCRRGLRSK